jgi:hypothetical protein
MSLGKRTSRLARFEYMSTVHPKLFPGITEAMVRTRQTPFIYQDA